MSASLRSCRPSNTSSSVTKAGVTCSFTGAFGTIATPTRVQIFCCSDAAREDRPFLRPSARSDLEICRKSVGSFKHEGPSTSKRHVGEVCQAVCQTCDGAMCSNLPGHHCLLPPHGVEDCTVFTSFFFLLCAWLQSRDLLLHLSRLFCLAPRSSRSCLSMPLGKLATLEAGVFCVPN